MEYKAKKDFVSGSKCNVSECDASPVFWGRSETRGITEGLRLNMELSRTEEV